MAKTVTESFPSEINGDFFSGIPVAVDPERIDRELAKLWKPVLAGESPFEEEGSAVTRACLSTLIFYLPDRAACTQARILLPQVGRRFPSRMILLTHGEAG